MSERYGACRHCQGRGSSGTETEWLECGTCGGTGFSGDAMDLVDKTRALRIPRTRDKPSLPKEREAIDLAVQAIQAFNSNKTIRHGR